MSTDKRTVATDALATLGTIIGEGEKRDAIHLAVEPVVAAEMLYPGQDVGLVNGKAARCPHPLGIVDPFLKMPVQPGERFWLIVYPRQITSLRHVWEHPSFPAEAETVPVAPDSPRTASEKWLRDFVARSDCPDYEAVIAAAVDNRDSWNSEYLHFNDRDAHGEIPPEFWTHVEIVTGRTIPQDKRAEYFSCSC